MKSWHIGIILLVVVAYLLGTKYPQAGQVALGKVGL